MKRGRGPVVVLASLWLVACQGSPTATSSAIDGDADALAAAQDGPLLVPDTASAEALAPAEDAPRSGGEVGLTADSGMSPVDVAASVDVAGPVDVMADAASADAGPAADAPEATDGGGQVMLTTYFDRLPRNAALVAYQADDGPWQRLTGSAGRYTLPVPVNRYGLAVVCEQPGNRAMLVQALARELSELNFICVWAAGLAPATATLEITVPALPPGAKVQLSYSDGTVQLSDSFDGAQLPHLHRLPPGTYDLLARRELDGQVERLIFKRDLVVAGTVPLVLDFDKDGAAPLVRQLALSGEQPGEQVHVFSQLLTRRVLAYVGVLEAPRRPLVVPADQRRPADVHVVEAFATASSVLGDSGRGSFFYVHDPRDATVVLPAPAARAMLRLVNGRLEARFAARADMQLYVLDTGGWSINLTAGWLGAAATGTHAYTFPDAADLRSRAPSAPSGGYSFEVLSSDHGPHLAIKDQLIEASAAGTEGLEGRVDRAWVYGKY